MNKDEKPDFWNDPSTVVYFEDKPADPRIVRRLATYLKSRTEGATLRGLDLGCGGGRHTELLHDLGFEVYACDVNPAMLEATRRRVPEAAHRVTYGSIQEIAYPDAFFDVVITTGVLHQAESREEYARAIQEISRITKAGGLCLMNIFTNRTVDPALTLVGDAEPLYRTNEDLLMTLLSSDEASSLFYSSGFELEPGSEEADKVEPTGIRTVFRAIYKKHS